MKEIRYYHNLTLNFAKLIPYIAEFNLLNTYSTFRGHPLRDANKHKRLKRKIIPYIQKGLLDDARLCTDLGIKNQPPTMIEIKNHLSTLLKVFSDYQSILKRRKNNKTKLKNQEDYPEYYKRHFHFQTDGYMSEHSASIYDHQVDILFAGMATPMRRVILEELRSFKPKSILELGCGTGSTTKIVTEYLQNAEILATDLSHDYIAFCQNQKLNKNITFKQLDATKIKGNWDFIFHVFLMHELPSKERTEVLKNQLNCLTKDGKGVIIESLQVGDIPFLDEVLYDFPKYYHEPFYKHYIDHSLEKELAQLGAKNIQVTKRLFSKCISFTRL